MKVFRNLGLPILTFLVILVAGPAQSQAGVFTMKQCEGAMHIEFQAPYSGINGGSNVDVVRGCDLAHVGKIGIYQDRAGPHFSYGNGGQFIWYAPEGIGVIATEFTARLKNANGIKAQLVGWNGSNLTYLDGGYTHDGTNQVRSWSNSANPQPMVIARLICETVPSCENKPSSAKAYMEVTDVALRLRDSAYPSVWGSGEMWSWGGDGKYHRGSAALRVEATDQGSGVAEAWIEVNGLRVELADPDCQGIRGTYTTRFTPCSPHYGMTRWTSTTSAPFREGSNQVKVCAGDFAETKGTSNRSCGATKTLLVDNGPPAPPMNLRVREGEAWRPVNGFNLAWSIPEGQVSAIAGVDFEISDLDTGAVVESAFMAGRNIEELGPIEAPAPGAYRVAVRLIDEAGNQGAPAETVIRFDDRPPGDVVPEPPGGWISRDEMPFDQRIEKAEPGGPSGIGGYALAVSDNGPAQPCSSIVCLAPEITLAQGPEHRTGTIGGLGEGAHWVTAAAVSGAGRASLDPGATQVRVDRTPPEVAISGVPSGWVNHPVTVVAHSSDDLSGMRPSVGDDGNPRTVIQAGNYAPYATSGEMVTFTIATEGVNRVKYWAEDLAGNANDGEIGRSGERHLPPGQAIVQIDMTPPHVRFDPRRDPSDPEVVRIEANDIDSGLENAGIGIRPAGSGDGFQHLSTTGGDGRYQTRIPSDDLPAGSYELVASAKDRAGNVSTGALDVGGQPMILNLPLKSSVSVSATLSGGKRALRTGYAKRKFVEGRLTVAGRPLSDESVRIVESFPDGARKRERQTVTRTDGDGRYRVKLPAGPSRVIQVRFPGSATLRRTESNRLRLDVRGMVRLRTKPTKVFNGGVVKMKGRVGLSDAISPARGKLVAIQYLDPARRKWRPVEVLRANRRGTFRYRYRFRTIGTAQRIVFRAIVLPESGWPYLTSTSRPKSVIVYPKPSRR